jgi:hypothetical protein
MHEAVNRDCLAVRNRCPSYLFDQVDFIGLSIGSIKAILPESRMY